MAMPYIRDERRIGYDMSRQSSLADAHYVLASLGTCCRSVWEPISDSSSSNGLVWLRPNSAYSVSRNEKIYTLKPDRDEKLCELQLTTLILPEHLDRLRAVKKKEEFVNVLELTNDPVAGPTSLEVCAFPCTCSVPLPKG
jgi:hypothetical protein